MTINHRFSTGVALAIMLSLVSVPLYADRERRGDDRQDNAYYKKRGYELDKRYRHNRYYPPRGQVEKVLPPAYRRIPYRGTNYYYHSGVWYRPSGSRFTVILPPVGLVVPFLPPFHTTIWVGGIPYYYAAGAYYLWRPEDRTYIVTDPPPESEILEQPDVPEQLYIYPQKGQNDQQQAADRYQCHSWSTRETGFDPTLPGGNVPEAQHPGKRSDYNRAMKACLEARGYSVQ